MERMLRDDWIAALRGGRYKQARKSLRHADEFCCMGVLCDVYDPQGWQQGDASISFDMAHELAPAGVHIEPDMLPLVGLSVENQQFLIGANDRERWHFHAIAAWIEENL